MRARPFNLLAISGLLTCTAGPWALNCARAQQDGDVTVVIKAKSNPGNLPTLLVMCDLACKWKLDGKVQGQIDPGGSAKVKVEPGQHMVEAATEDGADQVKQPSTVNPTGQTMVNIEFQPIRDARLIAEQEAMDEEMRDEAAQEQAAKEDATRQEREQLERKRIERDKAAGVWTDTATGLMWTAKDNGDENVKTEKQASQSDLTWQQAVDYCQNLRQGGHSDWRLPTIEELHSIEGLGERHPGHDHGFLGDWRVKGSLQLTGKEWSNTPSDDKHAWDFDFFNTAEPESFRRDDRVWMRALCVRSSGN